MTILVGYAVDQGGRAALDLGVQLARAAGDSLLAVTVVPRPWPTPSMAKIDGEFADWASAHGADSVAQAKAYLATIAADVTTDAVSAAGKSVPGTLVSVLEEHGADLLVIGSADDGRHGRIAVGSTAGRLLHSSPVPVVLAPRGYRAKAGVTVRRVTCSYAATPGASAVLKLAAAVANRFGTALRIATFGVRGRTMYPPETGLHSEDVVLTEWRSQATAAQQEALAELEAESSKPKDTTLAFGAGSNWTDALEDLEWEDGEILVIGSSPIGPLARVFLGSRATKIVRHSPVPVVVVPSVEAAEEATEKLV